MTPQLLLDRRDVLKLGGAAAIMSLVPSGMPASAADLGGQAASPIVLADPRYGESVSFASGLERHGAKVRALTGDRAKVWFDAVEPQLSAGLEAMAGLTLESDLFALERLAEHSGARTSYLGSHDWRRGEHATHLLQGSIELDRIAASLVHGKDRWAEGLGSALGLAKGESQEEQRLALTCPAPAAQGPRFFVSWLMRWRA
jgi:hypothetical protein